MKRLSVALVFGALSFFCAGNCRGDSGSFAVSLGAPCSLIFVYSAFDADYNAGAGFLGNDFSFTLDKIYAAEFYEAEIFDFRFPVRMGWGLRFTNSYHPVFGLRWVLYAGHKLKSGRELFMQIAPLYRLMPSYGINFDWVVGLRFGKIWEK